MAESFSVLHINARSLSANIDTLLHMNAGLNFQFSIIAVTEVWANSNNTSFLTNCIPGYNCYLRPRNGNRRGGGTAIYVKKNLTYYARDYLLKYESGELELSAIEISGLDKKKQL